MENTLSYLLARTARGRFTDAYRLVLEAIARVMLRYGISSVDLRWGLGPACHNVCDRTGATDRIVRIAVSRTETGHDTLTAWGELGDEYPLGLDIDGQDDWSLSSPVLLLDAVCRIVACYATAGTSGDTEALGQCRPIRTGDRVRWADPAIGDFDPEDRLGQVATVYTVLDAPEYMEEDSVVLISDGVGETEVFPRELALAYES